MGDTQRSQTVSTKLQRIAEQAKAHPDLVFTSLAHLIDVDFLREAYHLTRKDGARGVDGVTGRDYGEDLEENLKNLHDRLREQGYKAAPVRRTWIEKDDGSQRPLGIPTFEDKIVQRAVSMLMGAVYEQDFYPFSHGFRAGHSPHQAIRELREECVKQNIKWIVDADVSKFFDKLDHGLLQEIIQKRINDGGVTRLIGKWLKAGVLEEGKLTHSDQGTPQGGVISPLLANIFLHHVLDEWYAKEIKPRLRGRSFLTRFADDFVCGCELESDARRLLAVLAKRFNRFKLSIHPEKTKLVNFQPPEDGEKSSGEPRTFDFLGFTHYWAKSRSGRWVIKRKTSAKRLRRAMKSIWEWCRDHRHWNMAEQYSILCSKLRGHYQYYAIRANYKMLEVYLEHVEHCWRQWLGKRTRNGYISGSKFARIRAVYPLPTPRIIHSI
jgi:group II intron reverse transcriptase/maturase